MFNKSFIVALGLQQLVAKAVAFFGLAAAVCVLASNVIRSWPSVAKTGFQQGKTFP